MIYKADTLLCTMEYITDSILFLLFLFINNAKKS